MAVVHTQETTIINASEKRLYAIMLYSNSAEMPGPQSKELNNFYRIALE